MTIQEWVDQRARAIVMAPDGWGGNLAAALQLCLLAEVHYIDQNYTLEGAAGTVMLAFRAHDPGRGGIDLKALAESLGLAVT